MSSFGFVLGVWLGWKTGIASEVSELRLVRSAELSCRGDGCTYRAAGPPPMFRSVGAGRSIVSGSGDGEEVDGFDGVPRMRHGSPVAALMKRKRSNSGFVVVSSSANEAATWKMARASFGSPRSSAVRWARRST
jgi:hypothetical protein